MTNEQSIIDDHRNMLMVSKSISDFQQNNLSQWIFILFNNLTEAQIKFNFINHKKMFYAGVIEYDLSFKENQEPNREDATKQKQILEVWVQELFWTDTKVIIKKDGVKWI